MKTRKVKVEITIPDWIPTQRDLQTLYRSVKYKLFPFRCEETGERVNFKYPQYSYQHKRRVMISTYNHVRSRSQWIKYVRDCFACADQNEDISYFAGDTHVKRCTCDSCGFERPTIGMAPDIRIGMQWWNGFRVCENCLTETIRLGSESSSVFIFKNGTSWAINEAGVPIKPQPQSTEPTTIVCNPDGKSLYW